MPTHYTGSSLKTKIALDTFIKLTRANNALEHFLFQSSNLEGLTQSQFGVLETLYHLGSMCQGELSSKLLSSTGNMTLVLDNLEKQNLVKRIRDENDRRMIMIHLTEAGSELIERLFPEVASRIEASFSGLTISEQETLGRITKKLGLSIG